MSLLIDLVKQAKGKSTEKVSDFVREQRLDKCRTCPNLLITGNCSKCKCFVSDKTKYKGEFCPHGKW